MAHEAMKAEEARQGQISEQLGRLEEAIEQLAHTVGRVEGRLGPVLRPLDDDEKKSVVDELLVPLAETINTLAHRVRRQTERLTHIVQRLEL